MQVALQAEAAPVEAAAPQGEAPRKGSPGRKPDSKARAFNRAVLNLIEGSGRPVPALCVLTGLSEDSIKSRAMRARFQRMSAVEVREERELDDSERRYLNVYYRKSDDPAVRKFIGR